MNRKGYRASTLRSMARTVLARLTHRSTQAAWLATLVFVFGCNGSGGTDSTGVEEAPAAAARSEPEGVLTLTQPVAPVPPRVEGRGENLVTNGGFEAEGEGVPGWELAEDVAKSIQERNTWFTEGTKSMAFRLSAQGGVLLKQTVPVNGGSRHLLRANVFTSQATGSIRLAVEADRLPAFTTESVSGSPDTWRLLETAIDFPATVESAQVSVLYEPAQDQPDPGSVWIDDVQLFAAASRDAKNFVTNGDFDSSDGLLFQWIGADQLVTSLSTEGVNSRDRHSLLLECAPDRNIGIYQEIKGLTPGASYRLAGYIRCKDLAGDACLEVQHGVKGYQAFMDRSPAITGTQPWTPLSLDFTCPADTSHVNIFLRRPGVASAPEAKTGMLWFDRISLVSVANTP
ncbi:MAG: hypothetical protein AMXMBFR84_30460 [Candidatus Hydrogenedentota bacterium]